MVWKWEWGCDEGCCGFGILDDGKSFNKLCLPS